MPTIDATPSPFTFEPERTAVLCIDLQRDFMEPGGFGAALGNDVGLLQACLPAAVRLQAACRAAGMRVVHTREGHLPDLTDCPPAKRLRGKPSLRIGDPGPLGRILITGEPGNALLPKVAALPGEPVIDKPGKGAFCRTGLEDLLALHKIHHLLFCGVTTEVCVQTTMREANDRGFECLLVEDACASYFPAFHDAVLAMVAAQGGIVGWTAPVAAVETALAAAGAADAEGAAS